MEQIRYGLNRDEPFSYQCNQCKRCCYGKWIPLSPYDLIRLAHCLNISTGALIETYTTEGVRLLRKEHEEGTPCVFLTEEGCSVHAHRPAVCRLYPLGQNSMPDGSVHFGHLPPHPSTEGTYGLAGTNGSYLSAQGYEPYEEAAVSYGELYEEILDLMTAKDCFEQDIESEIGEWHMLDVDQWVADYCSAEGIDLPTDPESKRDLHIAAVRAWLKTF